MPIDKKAIVFGKFHHIFFLFQFHQLLDISVLDYDDVMGLVSEPYGQIKMDRYLWAVGFVDHCVIAHGANKRNFVPMAKHTVTDPVFWPVAFFVKVI